MKKSLRDCDAEVFNLIQNETARQEYGLELIPSENFVSESVLEASGSILTNKYAEGLPGKRYYGGCEFVDQIESLAIARAKKLFGCQFANVQPHSGAQANQIVYQALLNDGDVFMGMRLDHGGHLTHGSPVNFSGKKYKVVSYGVHPETGLIDMDQVRSLAKEHKPKLIVCGASAYPRQINFKAFREVGDEVGSPVMADIAHYAGLVAASEYDSPFPHCQIVTTTTHKTLRGPRSGLIMATAEFEKSINKTVFPGVQGGPHMHTIAAKAVCFKECMQPEFKLYAKQIIANAKVLGSELAKYGFLLVSGGTDSHLLLLDLRPLGLNGKEVQVALDLVGITTNKNTIPFDPQPPTVCSGLRLGTPAVTTRGMKENEMREIASLIKQAVDNRSNETELKNIRAKVKELSASFPLYAHRLVTD